METEESDLEIVHKILKQSRITDSIFDAFMLQELILDALKKARANR